MYYFKKFILAILPALFDFLTDLLDSKEVK